MKSKDYQVGNGQLLAQNLPSSDTQHIIKATPKYFAGEDAWLLLYQHLSSADFRLGPEEPSLSPDTKGWQVCAASHWWYSPTTQDVLGLSVGFQGPPLLFVKEPLPLFRSVLKSCGALVNHVRTKMIMSSVRTGRLCKRKIQECCYFPLWTQILLYPWAHLILFQCYS